MVAIRSLVLENKPLEVLGLVIPIGGGVSREFIMLGVPVVLRLGILGVDV
jgi:hypothetical protein